MTRQEKRFLIRLARERRQRERITTALRQAETETERAIIRKVLSNYQELEERNKKSRVKHYQILGII